MHRSIAECVTLACLLEATAPKPGNVHRGADFEDLKYPDLLVSAVVIGPILERLAPQSVGQAVLSAVQAIRATVGTNTNLGTILLLAPLVAVPRDEPLAAGVDRALAQLTAADCHAVYEAIRFAHAGGLGQVHQHDVAGPPPDDLVAAMRLAEDRDMVARQYANGFSDVLTFVAPTIKRRLDEGRPVLTAIVLAQLETMSRYPDSLIARKCGNAVAKRAADQAAAVLAAALLDSETFWSAVGDFDFWLRSDGHRRNPGTTADLLAAALFALLRDGQLTPPFDWT